MFFGSRASPSLPLWQRFLDPRKGGGRGQHHFSAQQFNRGGGPGTQNFSMGDPFFRGRMSLGQFLWNPIPHVIFHWDPDSLLHQDPSLPRVSAVSGFVCFLFFTSQSTIFRLRQDGSSCVEQVLSQDKCFLLKDTIQWHRWGSNPRPFSLKWNQALYHWATALPTVSGRVRVPGAYRHIAIHFDIKSPNGSTHVDRKMWHDWKMLTCTLCINTNKGSRMIVYRGCKILPIEYLFAYCHDQWRNCRNWMIFTGELDSAQSQIICVICLFL